MLTCSGCRVAELQRGFAARGVQVTPRCAPGPGVYLRHQSANTPLPFTTSPSLYTAPALRLVHQLSPPTFFSACSSPYCLSCLPGACMQCMHVNSDSGTGAPSDSASGRGGARIRHREVHPSHDKAAVAKNDVLVSFMDFFGPKRPPPPP